MYAKRPPDAEGAERRKNKADKSSLWANEFNRKLTYRKRSSWAEQDGQIPAPPPPRPPSLIPLRDGAELQEEGVYG